MPYVEFPDWKQEMVNAAINIQAIVNILSTKGIILSQEEWASARYQAALQLQGKYGYTPPPPPDLSVPG